MVRWWSSQRLHKRNIFFPAPFPSHFLVLFVEFFLENSQKQVFLHNVMNLILLPALLFFGWENFAMMIQKKDSRQLVRPCRTQKNNKEGFTFILSMRTAVSPWSAPKRSGQLYFPLASEDGLKSCVSPDLGGDAKLDQETFLLEPVSVENLHKQPLHHPEFLAGGGGRHRPFPYRRLGSPAGGKVYPPPRRTAV